MTRTPTSPPVIENNRYRYLIDPIYHHAVDVLVRAAIDAVDRADAEPDDEPRMARRQRAVTLALLGVEKVGLV
jgi:hypothetical protein